MKAITAAALVAVLAAPAAARGPRDLNEVTVPGNGSENITAEIWVDNWFSLWVNGEKIAEDATPYHTERSFNAERIHFTADRPLSVAIELRDFMQNDTGLEYIGTRRQQMGDGGAIFQFFDEAGALIGASNASWRCHVAQHAPVNPSCAAESDPKEGIGACASVTDSPEGWQAPGFDDSAWPNAVVHSAHDVGPKDGYDMVRWSSQAKLIWGPDLHQDNILYCRATLR